MSANPPKPLESQVTVGPPKPSSPNSFLQYFRRSKNNVTKSYQSENIIIIPNENNNTNNNSLGLSHSQFATNTPANIEDITETTTNRDSETVVYFEQLDIEATGTRTGNTQYNNKCSDSDNISIQFVDSYMSEYIE